MVNYLFIVSLEQKDYKKRPHTMNAKRLNLKKPIRNALKTPITIDHSDLGQISKSRSRLRTGQQSINSRMNSKVFNFDYLQNGTNDSSHSKKKTHRSHERTNSTSQPKHLFLKAKVRFVNGNNF